VVSGNIPLILTAIYTTASCQQYCSGMISARWFGGVLVEYWTYDDEVVGSTPRRVAIKWLLLQRIFQVFSRSCGQVDLLNIQPTSRST